MAAKNIKDEPEVTLVPVSDNDYSESEDDGAQRIEYFNELVEKLEWKIKVLVDNMNKAQNMSREEAGEVLEFSISRLHCANQHLLRAIREVEHVSGPDMDTPLNRDM